MRKARDSIVKLIQSEHFSHEIASLLKGEPLKNSTLLRLNPTILDGMLCVGGRLQRSNYCERYKHPIILPRDHHVTNLLVDHYHRLEGHCGVLHVLGSIRQTYWIPRAATVIKRILKRCTNCRRRTTIPSQQMMSDLPEDRIQAGWYPFQYVGIDYFGPFIVRKNRKSEKRYGCIFTCLQCRAVHLEVAQALDADSFVLTLMRFINRRGKPSKIYSDNGSNFVGAVGELSKQLREWNQDPIRDRLLSLEIDWYFHPPAASHRGGIWERLIRSTRRILNSMIAGQYLTDETLSTFFTAVERVMNNRPIVSTRGSDENNDEMVALKPNDLLRIERTAGISAEDNLESLYIRKWKQVNYMTLVFWRRWVKEYVPTLQIRQKWCKKQRNFKQGDIVLVVSENCPREHWPLGIIEDCHVDSDGAVRTVKVRTRDNILLRDVRKICLLEGFEEEAGWPD